MSKHPKDPTIRNLWVQRESILHEASKFSAAIQALQALCKHPNIEDVSRHGSPMLECPDCGEGF